VGLRAGLVMVVKGKRSLHYPGHPDCSLVTILAELLQFLKYMFCILKQHNKTCYITFFNSVFVSFILVFQTNLNTG